VTVDTRPERRFTKVWVMLSMVALIAAFFVAGFVAYRAYLSGSHNNLTAVPQPSQHAALARRAVIFIIDGFHPERAFDPTVMPAFSELAARGAAGIAKTDPITMTGPAVYSLMTGRPASLVQAIMNFSSPETRVDSLPSLVAAGGGKIVLAGDPSWHKQFGWLVPRQDRYQSREVGITTDPWINDNDRLAVEFLLTKLSDPPYVLAIVHLTSVDAVGHKVTPLASRYFEQLTFVDSLLQEVISEIDLSDTVLLVTGDHGLAARGTHGGEEEARFTPYVLAGSGIKRGVKANLPQSALTTTLVELLGLPILSVSQHPPRSDLLAISEQTAVSVRKEYLERKLAVVRRVGSASGWNGSLDDPDANLRLNEALFGASESKWMLRLLAALAAVASLIAAAAIVWGSTPRQVARPPLLGHLVASASVPLAIMAFGTIFMAMRSRFPYPSHLIATSLAALLLLLMIGLVVVLYCYRRSLGRWHLSLFFSALILVNAPLVTSMWMRVGTFFGIVLVALCGVAVSFSGATRRNAAMPLAGLLAVTGFGFYGDRLPAAIGEVDLVLVPLSGLLVWLGLANLRRDDSIQEKLGRASLSGILVAAWLHRLFGGTAPVMLVLGLFLLLIVLAYLARGDGNRSATLLIVGTAGQFLPLANNDREAMVFLAAAIVALLVSRRSFNLRRPEVLYTTAGLAIVFRICLFFALGDYYLVSSIRTAPGFLLMDLGFPLIMAVGLLMLKYTLPWLLIFAMAFNSLQQGGRSTTGYFVQLLALGYVARFAVVAAVLEPFRNLPNGMECIVGVFCISWAEFITFAIAAWVALVFLDNRPVAITQGALATET